MADRERQIPGGGEPRPTAAARDAPAARARPRGAALLQVQRQRALKAEARRKELEGRLQKALDEAEEHRIVAIELRTMLDATYYRISTLEKEVEARQSESAATGDLHRADLERLGAAAEETQRRLAEVESERESARRDVEETRAELEAERRWIKLEVGSLRAELEQRVNECMRADEELRRALDAGGDLRRSVAELSELRAREEAEAAELRAWVGALEHELDVVREGQTGADERCVALTAEVEALNAALDEARSWAVSWQAAVEEHRGEVERLARGLEAAAETERVLNERLSAVDAELALVQEELSQARGALSLEQWAHSSNLESLRTMIAEQARQVVELGARLEEAGETSAALEGRLAEVMREAARRAQDRERLASALAAVQAERDHWRHEWQGAAGATVEMQREGEVSRGRARDASERAERAEESLLAVQSEIDALRAELVASHERQRGGEEWLSALQAQIVSLEQEGALLQQLRSDDAEAIRCKEESLGQALQAGAQLWRELADRVREQESAEAEVERLEESVRALGSQLEREVADHAAESGMRRDLEERVQELEGAANAGEAAVANLTGVLQQRDTELAEARAGWAEAERLRGEAALSAESLESRRAEIEQELARAQTALEQATGEARLRGEEVERRRTELEEQLAVAGRELEGARHELARQSEEAERRRVELEEQLATARRELELAREEAARETTDREEKVGSLEGECRRLQARVEQVEHDRLEIEDRLAAVEQLRQELAQQVTALRGQVEERERDLFQLRCVLEEADAERGRSKEVEARLLEERDAAAQRIAAAEDRSAVLQAEVEELRRSTATWMSPERQVEMEAQIEELRAAIATAQEREARLREAAGDLEQQLRREQAESSAAADRSTALQAEVEELRGSIATWMSPERQAEMEAQIEELRAAVAIGQEREVRLQELADDLQQQLLREQAQSASLWSDLESQNRFREALDSALAEARSRYGELESALQREQRRWTEREAIERDSAAETAGLLARTQLLEARASEAEVERDALRQHVLRLEASSETLEKECDQLRRRAAQGDERETARLQARIEDLERQQRDAVQRHSGAVSSYMLELNQRTETLRQRDAEIHRLSEELGVMQGACDDAVSQVGDLKNERDALLERVRELEASRPAPALRARPAAASAPAASGASVELEEALGGLRLAEEAAPPPAAEEKKRPLQTPTPKRRAALHRDDEPLWLLHAEEDAALQGVVRSAVSKFPNAHYALSSEAEQRVEGRPLLALNMLTRTIDPIATLAECAKLGIDDPAAFTYFAYGGRGFVAGMVDYFPHPFEPDGCASRLLGRSGGLQRLLAVSEDVDAMTGIREVLGRVRCSAATAFDGRQAMDLVPMIKPEVVLVDLSLPRGEALRVVSRICTDPKTASIGIALFWTQPITQKEIAQAALRVVRDFPLTAEDLGSHLARLLNEEEFGLVTAGGIRASA
jgi:chromosome segregation ATPase/CheY-like chemotaxis protein